jgi:DUF2934 family protein
MWFAEQLDSFLSLGICKEYPNMAKSKSTSGSKAERTNTNTDKQQVNTSSPANIPDVKAVSAEAVPAQTAAESKAKVGSRKLAVVKTEPRKNGVNLVPINLEEEIRRRAYELYQQRGTNSGSEAEDWLTAEREVRQRYHQQSA